MSDQNIAESQVSAEEREADSRVDMWSAVALVMLAWAVAIFWVSGQ